ILIPDQVLHLWNQSGPVELSLEAPTGGRTTMPVLWDSVEQGPVSLNEMFQEVEELMEDTQQLLDEAVDQVSLPPSSVCLHPSSRSRAAAAEQDEDGSTDGSSTAAPHPPRFLQLLTEPGGSPPVPLPCTYMHARHRHQHFTELQLHPRPDCLVDEDCGSLKYCLYELDSSQCLPCVPADMPCTTDQECCRDQLCVWGQCTEDSVPGSEGTICQGQRDCRPDLCCAFQREFLFPVCNPRPGTGDPCLNRPHLLLDLLAWDQDGPRGHCPCAEDLQCQSHSRGSVCGPKDRSN
uniref:Dickkopf N-terminal cysteine-rich domain-containing protein n=1 Tax=Salarias fasciatus TaxID=181472 RepID=A0A672GEW6_SALFA